MARRKKILNETPEQMQIRKDMEKIANNAVRGDKTSFSRKLKNMDRLIKKLQPVERQIIALMAKKMPIIDSVTTLRAEMVDTCVHPMEYLIHKGDHIECKFCLRKIQIKHD